MTIENLLLRKKELTTEISNINNQIYDYKDGFEYVVCINSYGSHYKQSFNNLHSALDVANKYYEDNGFAYLYTNNPNVKVRLSGGDVYFIKDTTSVSAYTHPNDSILLQPEKYSEEDLKNESELNSFESTLGQAE
jgi:hypothetical protein